MKIRHRITRARKALKREGAEAGMTTAEYSVDTLAPCRKRTLPSIGGQCFARL